MNNNKISPGMSESQRSSEVHIPLPMTFEYLKMDLLQKTPKKLNILQNITNKKQKNLFLLNVECRKTNDCRKQSENCFLQSLEKKNVENKCFSLLEAVKYNQAMTDEMLAAGDEQLIF